MALQHALGSEHPDSLGSKQNLALVCWVRGRCFEAMKLMEKVFELSTKVMGEGLPGYATASHQARRGSRSKQEGEEDGKYQGL